ncbi:MAG: protein arginine kinase [Massiliimalia sp.]|jgi:protein arginine kinase
MNKWFDTPAEENGIVISSRIRLARNVIEFPFHRKMTGKQREKLNQMVKEALSNMNLGENKLTFVNLGELNQIKRQSLIEKHLISRELAQEPEGRMLVVSEDESVAIMVNEEDHLRIQVMANGLNLRKAYETCNMLDDVLDETLHYAFDEKLGYLTACPTNLGTGLRASVMMHLPALEASGLISRLTSTISKLGLTIRGTYGEGSSVLGSIYQISNQITLGITESDAIQNLESVAKQIIQSENIARENRKKSGYELEDTVFRSLGILRYARLLSTSDFFQAASQVRLGVSMGYIQDVPMTALNDLMGLTGAASVCELAGKELAPEERDYMRAKIVREKLAEEHA